MTLTKAELNDERRMWIVSCAGCEKRYLRENAEVQSMPDADGEVKDENDHRERCPFCGVATETSEATPFAIELPNDE